MARTWQSPRPKTSGPGVSALSTEKTAASLAATVEPQGDHRSPSPKPSADDPFSDNYNGGTAGRWGNNSPQPYYTGLARRWGVMEAELDYQNDVPRIWLRDSERSSIDHDEWSLSPWALAYYDRYSEDMDDETLECYHRSVGKPRVDRFMDTKEVTSVVKGNDGSFKPATSWQQMTDEPVVDPEAPSYWYTRKYKPRSNWLATAALLHKPKESARPRSPMAPSHNVGGLQYQDSNQSQAVDEHASKGSDTGGELHELDEGYVGHMGAEPSQLHAVPEGTRPLDPRDDVGLSFKHGFATVLEEDPAAAFEAFSGVNLENSFRAIFEDDDKEMYVESDISEPDEDLALQMYREDLEKIRSRLIKERRTILWRSFSPETRREYETDFPLYYAKLPRFGDEPAEQTSLENDVQRRKAYDGYLREHMPTPQDTKEEPKQLRRSNWQRR